MKLNLLAMATAFGLLWGGAILMTGVCNLVWEGYGQAFLDLTASIYPGYKATASFGQIIIGTLYGLADGGVAGLIFAWLYNLCASRWARSEA